MVRAIINKAIISLCKKFMRVRLRSSLPRKGIGTVRKGTALSKLTGSKEIFSFTQKTFATLPIAHFLAAQKLSSMNWSAILADMPQRA